MNNEAVKEYIELVGQDDNMGYINMNNVEIIDKIYRLNFLHLYFFLY